MEFKLDDLKNIHDAKSQLKRIPFLGGRTHTYEALDKMVCIVYDNNDMVIMLNRIMIKYIIIHINKNNKY